MDTIFALPAPSCGETAGHRWILLQKNNNV